MVAAQSPTASQEKRDAALGLASTADTSAIVDIGAPPAALVYPAALLYPETCQPSSGFRRRKPIAEEAISKAMTRNTILKSKSEMGPFPERSVSSVALMPTPKLCDRRWASAKML